MRLIAPLFKYHLGEGKTGLRNLFFKIIFSTKTLKGVGFLTPEANSHNLHPATTWLCPDSGSPLVLTVLQRRVPEDHWQVFSWEEDCPSQEAQNQIALKTSARRACRLV